MSLENSRRALFELSLVLETAGTPSRSLPCFHSARSETIMYSGGGSEILMVPESLTFHGNLGEILSAFSKPEISEFLCHILRNNDSPLKSANKISFSPDLPIF